VLLDEVAERIGVERVVDPGGDRVPVCVVERRSKLVCIGGDSGRAGIAECADDVDALPRAREQDCRHDYGG
jgi:hypothetical protein